MLTNCILISLSSFILVYFSTRKIIQVSYQKQLFDEPSRDRKVHLTRMPNLGGIAIFASLMFTMLLFLPAGSVHDLRYIIACAFIIFVIGLLDDLMGISPVKKFAIQLVVAVLITLVDGYRLTGFYGFLGLDEMPFAISIIITVLFMLLLINAFNLIDGINCLAGGIGLLTCIVFAFFFWRMRETGLLFMSIGLCGCLASFLLYNRTPAKIFMGDTGSLFIGFIVAIFSIRFIELNRLNAINHIAPEFQSAPAILLALLIIPVFDTLRVFFLRILKGGSPFQADRNHIHHLLIDLKFSHLQSTGILLLVNIIFLSLVYFLRHLGIGTLFFITGALLMLLNGVLWFALYRKKNKQVTHTYTRQDLQNTIPSEIVRASA